MINNSHIFYNSFNLVVRRAEWSSSFPFFQESLFSGSVMWGGFINYLNLIQIRQFILFGSKNVCTKLAKFFPVNILGTLLSPAKAIRNLGVWFDSDFSFSCHVKNICKACFVHTRDLKQLRGYLTCEAALLAANALVRSRLDYRNSLFRSLSALDLHRLQCVQNSLARIVVNTTKYSHITPVRKSLHWLPIMHHSVFNTALLVYKFLHSGHPKYFKPFLKSRHSVYTTRRSQSEGVLLEVPHFA